MPTKNNKAKPMTKTNIVPDYLDYQVDYDLSKKKWFAYIFNTLKKTLECSLDDNEKPVPGKHKKSECCSKCLDIIHESTRSYHTEEDALERAMKLMEEAERNYTP
jgi:hypothetical protein